MKFSRRLRGLLIVLFWLIVWQAAAVLINQRLLLVSPVDTVKALARLVPTRAFWHRIGFSAGRILTGFSLALVVGCLFAVLAHTSRLLRELLAPVMQLVKATPVASFIILALLWVRSKICRFSSAFSWCFRWCILPFWKGFQIWTGSWGRWHGCSASHGGGECAASGCHRFGPI